MLNKKFDSVQARVLLSYCEMRIAMDLNIYFPPGNDTPRDGIEKLLEAVLADSGEVTGGGSGAFGQNIDVEIFDAAMVPGLMHAIRAALIDFGAAPQTELVLDGQRSLLLEPLSGL